MRSSQVVTSVHGASALSSPIIHSEMLLRGREPRLSRLPSQQTILPGLGQPSLLGQHSHVAALSELINRQRILIQYQATSVGTPPSTSILLAHQNLLTQAFALGQTSAVLGTVTGNRPLSNTDESTRGFEGNAVFAKSRSGIEQQASAPHRSIGRSLGASTDAISQAASPNVASLARSLSAGNCSTDDSDFLLAALTCRRQPLACSIGEATKRKNGVKPTRETPKPVLSMETKMISKNGSEQKNTVHR
eukprot:CAMPEP_0202471550 /NCGR_PEP_ID=MMETSP1360-20130828/85068_1 /ASSEMBLY_ACC=CAM_ASM_000848 /TAXON_ID=515479 /ORGANISM="Licmophora paradoxa, Strain CCMP2313" /LENGTH=247 /DNA_ID=CAMNT_0049097711 /DNA_START=51 /DNA_END=794 /DNA_ORIENTATION=-